MRKDTEFLNTQLKLIDDEDFVSIVIKHNINAKPIISYLAKQDIPFKIIHLGGGVKKIIKQEDICPDCKGKGYIERR